MSKSVLTIWQVDAAQMTPFYNMAVCNALAQAGCDVRYLTSRYLHDNQLTTKSTYETNYIYFKSLNNPHLLQYPRLRRYLRGLAYPVGQLRLLAMAVQHKPDVVHMQWSRLPRLDYRLIRQLQRWEIPIVHTVHDVIPLYNKNAKVDGLERIYQAVDCLIVHTNANARELLKTYPSIPPDKVRQVPLVRFENPTMPVGASQNDARQQLGLPVDAPIVGFFGLIRESKGLDTLYDAFMQAHAKFAPLHLVVAGHANSVAERNLLKRFKNHPSIHVYPGYVPTSSIWKYHLAVDVMLFPYRHIYQSAALITAMGYGCAVIATSVGGMPETIDGNGWVIPPNDPQALADTILEAFSDEERLGQMGKQSLELVQNRHSTTIVAERLVSLYRDLL